MTHEAQTQLTLTLDERYDSRVLDDEATAAPRPYTNNRTAWHRLSSFPGGSRSPKDSSTQTQLPDGEQYIYRTQRVAIEEHPLGGWDLRTCKRTTRVVARYTHVLVKERVRDREAYVSDRGSNPTLCRTAEPGAERESLVEDEQPERAVYVNRKFSEAELLAIKQRGFYVAVEVFKAKPHHTAFMVRAKCTGPFCGGTTRVFVGAKWAGEEGRDGVPSIGCHACTRKSQAQRQAAKKMATGEYSADAKGRVWKRSAMLPTHGTFNLVELLNVNGALMVRGQCTGAACGGFVNDFHPASWQARPHAHNGCRRCATLKRHEREARAALEKSGAMLPVSMVARDMEVAV